MKRINYCHPINSMNPNHLGFINETKRNLSLIENIDWTRTKRKKLDFIFSGYKDGKDIIRPLAKGSCAYCGDKITQHTLVVEHYRPKNRLKARDNEFLLTNGEYLKSNKSRTISYYGYFILGSHYKNLIPACRPCNTGEGNKEGVYINNTLNFNIKYGKDDYFPILRKKQGRDNIYVKSIKNEYPLIFNPYKDNPNELFSYKITSQHLFKKEAIEIKPNKLTSKKKRLKAEITINLLGLNRQSLCLKRWHIYYNAQRVLSHLAEDLDRKTVTLDRCIDYAKELCRLNCETNGTMQGFTRIQTKKPIKAIYNVIRDKFPTEARVAFTNTNSFQERIKELKKFIEHHEPRLNHDARNINLNEIIKSYLSD